MTIKTGKEEIVYLLSKVIEKYKAETGKEIILNTNRKNYESIAIVLSEISDQLPQKWELWGTDFYEPELTKKVQEYPYRKYDITGGQIKDALNGIVSHPRIFLIDASYIYLYGVGRKAFEKSPLDNNLLLHEPIQTSQIDENTSIKLENNLSVATNVNTKTQKNKRTLSVLLAVFFIIIVFLTYLIISQNKRWENIKSDLNILAYKPSKAEIDSLEGIWLCYTGSPQARISDPNRYHKVVSNLVHITYKDDGYFTFIRYGASFNHVGYMQFESPGIISVYSRIKNNTNLVESPRHSLIDLNKNTSYLSAISSSWNFDVGVKNKIIGIREIYIKLGKNGTTNEILNNLENASCSCKVIEWQKPDNTLQKIYLKNTLLDSLNLNYLKNLIDEHSIIENTPEDKLLLTDSLNK